MVHWEETFMSAFFASSTASHGQIWDVDIYVRASREDGDKEQSETISNQITMLTDFVHGRPELRLHEIRKDDGISGVTFDRPGFHAVMDDVRSGAANCVVVKDYCAIIGLNQKDLENQGILA
jgi:DNA invertase Pin-like site-specific DNA recombinase